MFARAQIIWFSFSFDTSSTKMKEYFKIFFKTLKLLAGNVRRHVTLKMRAWRKILSSKTKMRMFRSFYT